MMMMYYYYLLNHTSVLYDLTGPEYIPSIKSQLTFFQMLPVFKIGPCQRGSLEYTRRNSILYTLIY